ncbi:type II secretion system protein GspM [Azotobacter chroococcum]
MDERRERRGETSAAVRHAVGAGRQALEQLLADQASRLQLKVAQVTSGGAGEVTLALDNADFNRLLQLLEQSSRDGIRLLKADLRSAAAPGRVGAQLTFSK